MGYIVNKIVKDKYGRYGPYRVLRDRKGDYVDMIGKVANTTRSDIEAACEEHDEVEVSEEYLSQFKNELRFGKASDPDVLRYVYDEAENIRDLDMKGNNKVSEMDVVEFDDGSEAYVTDIQEVHDMYPPMNDTEMLIKNNLRSSRIVEYLGGNACRCDVAEDEDGKEYLVKEGIEGDRFTEIDGERLEGMEESIEKTMMAGYFVGNVDLHAGNLILGEDDEIYIIDHDFTLGLDDDYPIHTITNEEGVTEIHHFCRFVRMNEFRDAYEAPSSIPVDYTDIRERIYDKAVEYKLGKFDIPAGENTNAYEYFEAAVDKAIEEARKDDYELPDKINNNQ